VGERILRDGRAIVLQQDGSIHVSVLIPFRCTSWAAQLTRKATSSIGGSFYGSLLHASICSADGSTHTESNKLYRKVKHRYRPNLSPRQRPTAKARHDQAALAASAEARGATHRARALGVLCLDRHACVGSWVNPIYAPRVDPPFLCHRPYNINDGNLGLTPMRGTIILSCIRRRFIIQRGHEHTRSGN